MLTTRSQPDRAADPAPAHSPRNRPQGDSPAAPRLTAWRLFFPLAALAAALWPLLPLMLGQGTGGHALVLVPGLAGAAMAGYALTALPGWDGGPVPAPAALMGLAAVWLAGMIGVALGAGLAIWPFALGLAALLLRRCHGKRRRLAVAAVCWRWRGW